MDAKTCIWVGYDDDQVLDKLPDEVKEQIGEDNEIEVNGLSVRDFYVSDNRVGTGVQVLFSDWDDSPMELDLDSLAKKALKLKTEVEHIFKAWGIQVKPKVFLLSDYS